jgi:hypothetical protein
MKSLLTFLFLLLAVSGWSQSYRLLNGYEETEHRYPNNIEKTQRIYTGSKLYNKSETIRYLNQGLPAGPNNCYVEAYYIWASISANGGGGNTIWIDRYFIFTCNPGATPRTTFTDVPIGPATSTPIGYPDTRIDNSYVVAGTSSNWSYCRSTWQLFNPSTDKEYYFPFKYAVWEPSTGQRWAYTGYRVPAGSSKVVVVGWNDLALDWGVYLPDTNIQPPAFGPYFGPSMTPVAIGLLPPFIVGNGTSFYLPQIPTTKSISDYIQLDFWNSLNK